MTPEEFTKFEDDKAIEALKGELGHLIDGRDMYHVFTALHEVYFNVIPHALKDPKSYLIRLAKDCLEKSKTIKPKGEGEL